jgi:hypothetical protein
MVISSFLSYLYIKIYTYNIPFQFYINITRFELKHPIPFLVMNFNGIMLGKDLNLIPTPTPPDPFTIGVKDRS